MVLYGMFLELHDLYDGTPILLRADYVRSVTVDPDFDACCANVVKVGYDDLNKFYVVEEDYETVRGLLGQIYGKKD